ncbi:MAG: hypothetical protein ACK46H_02265, partial [Bacteroidota bacterium]
MISQDVIEAAAQRLREAQAQGEPCAPVRELIGEANIEAAYAVQKVNNDLRVAQIVVNFFHSISGFNVFLPNQFPNGCARLSLRLRLPQP